MAIYNYLLPVCILLSGSFVGAMANKGLSRSPEKQTNQKFMEIYFMGVASASVVMIVVNKNLKIDFFDPDNYMIWLCYVIFSSCFANYILTFARDKIIGPFFGKKL